MSPPHFGPQNPAQGGTKISREPVQNMRLQSVLAIQLRADILRS